MIIAFVNHKGGTGKTTSTINVGKALLNMGFKVLLIDLDPQGNLTYSLGISGQKYSVADFLLGKSSFNETACEVNGIHVLPAEGSLYERSKEISLKADGEYLLKNCLEKIKSQYDFILIDNAPTLSVYVTNTLNAAEGVIIPLVFEILSIQGLDQILTEIKKIQKSTNPGLIVLGVMGVIVNESRKLSQEVLEFIRNNYQINVFNNHVRNNVKAAEAPSFGLSVLEYAPTCISSRDYMNVTKELLTILEMDVKI